MDEPPIIVAYCTPGPYEAEARRLTASARRLGVSVELSVLPDRGSWQANTLGKQQFLAEAWARWATPERGILYVDADAVLHADPRDYYRRPPASQCDVGVLTFRGGVSNGTLFLRQTPRAKLLLAAWGEVNREHPERIEQQNMAEAMTRVPGLVVHPLPPEHCWIFDLSEKHYGRRASVIEHLQASRTHRRPRRNGREHHTRVKRLAEIDELLAAVGGQRLILIVGCGGSGTNWLGQIMAATPGVEMRIEDPEIFPTIADAAMGRIDRAEALNRIEAHYRERLAAAPQHFCDKSHANLWLAQDIAERLPQAVFVGIERCAYGTAASLLRRGLHDWTKHLPECAFLGMTAERGRRLDELSDAQRAGMQWAAHARRLAELRADLPGRVHVVGYERLAAPESCADELRALSGFLGFLVPMTVRADRMAVGRWRRDLSAEQRREIREATAAMATPIENRQKA